MPEKNLLQEHESAASEIVGTLVLIALIAGALAILATVLLSQPAPGKIPSATIVIANESTIVRLYHEGGDAIPVADIAITVNGNPVSFSGAGADNVWAAGEFLTVVAPALPQKVTVIWSGGNGRFVLISAAPELR
ncbi:MAG TPA: type IV pilin N-terminal domain-containing protein [Methanoregulaceae archaeon]|nr:type IV pilin N-terminal domain-containing protein [Methanoregulaceae archaeon]